MVTHTPLIPILQGSAEMSAALTMNSRVRKALFGTKRRLGPFFTMVYLQTGASQSAPQQDANVGMLAAVDVQMSRGHSKPSSLQLAVAMKA